MKRTLVVLALLLAVGLTLCFADDAAKPAGITWGAWGRAIYAPLMSSDSDVVSGMGTSWGGNQRIGFVVKGDSEFVGFYATLCDDGGTPGTTDDVSIYVKPLPGLKIAGGTTYDDTLRNTASCFGEWNWIRADGIGDTYGFSRVNEGTKISSEISYNANGIFVYFNQARPGTYLTTNGANGVVNNMSFGAGYTIAGIGQIKAQKVGYDSTGALFGIYEAGFALAAVPNLTAEADVWIPTKTKNAGYDYSVPLSASYKAGPATINAFFRYKQYNDDNTISGKKGGVFGGAGVDYDIGNGLGFVSSVRYLDKYSEVNEVEANDLQDGTAAKANNEILADGSNATDKARTTVCVGVVKTLGIGCLGVGFEYSTLFFHGARYDVQSADKAQWAIPIKWEYSF